MSKQSSLIKSAGMVTVLLVISRLLGFLRESAIAYRFGTTAQADAYLMASTLPLILFLAFNDAVKTAFIPVYGEYHRTEEGNALAQTVFVLLGAILVVVSMLLVAAAPLVVKLLAPGFEGAQKDLTIVLARIMLPGLLFMGLTGLASGILHIKKNFFIPAITAYPSNLLIILTAIIFGARYGIVGLAWGTMAGFASQFLVQVPAVASHGVFQRANFQWHHPGIKKILILLPPVIIGSAATELKSVIDRIFASLLSTGSIAALNYANRIYLLPNGIIILALLTVLYPALVELFAEDKIDDFKYTLHHGIGLIITLIFPIMVGMIILRVPIVRLLFERGVFDAAATQNTAFALAFYSLGLLPLGVMLLMSRAFYATKDTLTPMLFTFVTMIVNTVLNWLLMKPLAHGGLALGTATSIYVGAVGMTYLMWRKIGAFGGRKLYSTFWKTGLASALMGLLVWYGTRFLSGVSFMRQALEVGILIALGAGVYFVLIYLLKVEELQAALGLIRRRRKQ
ncbi:MAG TPA: murein biosynthesis integral membrane protein MurJ [Oscillospiraceae bacterium]|nr:murein biosynthesis integral membrane protein MurJ [Oscillospiraceae bacterium]